MRARGSVSNDRDIAGRIADPWTGSGGYRCVHAHFGVHAARIGGRRRPIAKWPRETPRTGAPAIAMATQLFSHAPERTTAPDRMALARRLGLGWRTRLGFRPRLRAWPVSTEGVALDTLTPPLPKHSALYNADDFAARADVRFALHRRFTEIVVDRDPDPWNAPPLASTPSRSFCGDSQPTKHRLRLPPVLRETSAESIT
jgi:hypothetical protein